ncbi:MAG: hypothetical protein FJ139_05700 [Deltaproteobacteria bacterium]|nr:hypothetical protein [Deltaproteobacteria bacterium]
MTKQLLTHDPNPAFLSEAISREPILIDTDMDLLFGGRIVRKDVLVCQWENSSKTEEADALPLLDTWNRIG